MRELLVAFLALPLVGCAMDKGECDPTYDQGFFNKLSCTVSGTYAGRVADREAQVAALGAERERLLALQAALDNERVLVKGSAAERQDALLKVQAEVRAMKSDLAKKRQLDQELKARLEEIEGSIGDMQKSGPSAPLLQKQAEYERLRQQFDDLAALTNDL
ncbi:MAG: hypothetical protein K6A65_02720 [Succinivibrionaceae bacterium]|nr:hypothetical protein [Succinivibrionaceae bacterium]